MKKYTGTEYQDLSSFKGFLFRFVFLKIFTLNVYLNVSLFCSLFAQYLRIILNFRIMLPEVIFPRIL